MTVGSRDLINVSIVVVLVKLYLIYSIPLTGDEAYFTQWAKYPDIGFYDHPPMIGWVMYLMSFFQYDISFFRVFSIITGFVVAFVLYEITKDIKDKESARFVALLFLISPINVLLSLVTNDVALLFFSSLAVLLFFKGEKRKSFMLMLLSGVFLGLAFLSKYFAVFIALSFVVYALIKRKKFLFISIFIVFLGVLPFGLENLYYNYSYCWNNILFNLVARTQDSSYNLSTVLIYIGFVIYFFMPWGLYYFFKIRKRFVNLKYVSVIVFLPLLLFFIVALKNEVGLHWLLSFIVYIFVFFAFLKQEEQKLFTYLTAGFSIAHVLFMVFILNAPSEVLKKTGSYNDIVMGTQYQKICQELEKSGETVFFAGGYTPAAIMEYHCNKEFHVLFNASKYGREDDKRFDVRSIDDNDIVFFKQKTADLEIYGRYFQTIRAEEMVISGEKYYLIFGSGFNYEKYKKEYLEKIKKRYYTIPEWLPKGQCYFNERYFSD